jgi:hypothetical protein
MSVEKLFGFFLACLVSFALSRYVPDTLCRIMFHRDPLCA